MPLSTLSIPLTLSTLSNKLKIFIQLKYLIDAYRLFPGKDSFFLKNNFFNKLAGNDELIEQVRKEVPEQKIRESWEPELSNFKLIRKKYLLYEDF